MPVLEISTLGPFNATYNQQPIQDFKTVKVQALFIYLVVERDRPHPRESLMELLWPDMPLESSQVNLRQTIYRLRQALPKQSTDSQDTGTHILKSDRHTISLNPDLEVHLDIERFQDLLDKEPVLAVEVYRGDFLSDFFLVDSNPYEEWAERIREGLRRKVLVALEKLTAQSIERSDLTTAQNYAWRQLEIDKLRESAYRQLMVILAQTGQRNAALAQFQQCQRRLHEYLGVQPSQETVVIYEQIQADALRRTKVPPRIKKSDSIRGMPIFLLTDIESSTRLWDTHHQAMLPALLKHNAILEEQISKHGGRILELRGDGVKAVFEGVNPLRCMIEIQCALAEVDWDEIRNLKIRIGLHGVPTVRKGYDYFQKDDAYYGPVLNHTARIMDAAWGGQILVSEQIRNTCSLIDGAYWKDFGYHRVKGLDKPIHIYGLLHPDLPIQEFPPLRTLDSLPEFPTTKIQHHHDPLPAQPTPFIGRQGEIASLMSILMNPETQLVSIVGPGGMGKTRFALATAERFMEACSIDNINCPFPDGILYVSLVSCNDEDQILTAVAKALLIPIETSQSSENLERSPENITTIKEKLTSCLTAKTALLILDNFEHLLNEALVVSEILAAGSAVKILITSRERLHIREEQVFPIEGLKYPDWEAPQTPGDFTAIEMFIQSARRVKPDYDPDFKDMIFLTRICRLVGGMPLGLELAASWIDVMSLRDIALEIQKNLDFLETDVRNIPERHRSMRAVFDSSWNRLSAVERQIFPRLSIFRGEFSRLAAENVGLASLRILVNLANKSLLKFDPDSNRYHIHELLRQYGVDKLRYFPQDEADTRQRHSIFFCQEIHHLMDLYTSGKSQLAIDRIEKDLTNILLAWEWALENSYYQQIDQAIDGICMFYDSYWRADEALTLCKNALDVVSKHPLIIEPQESISQEGFFIHRLYAKVLAWSAYISVNYQDNQADVLLDKALTIVDRLLELGFDAHGDKALILFFQGIVDYLAGDLEIASQRLTQALDLSKKIGLQWIILQSYSLLGDVARASGTPRVAKRWYGQCLSESRLQGNLWGEIRALDDLGWAARTMMAYDEAAEYYQNSLDLSISEGIHWETINAMQSLGFLSLFLGNLELALSRFIQTVEKSKELGMTFRTLPSQTHVGVTRWLMGSFEQAEEAFNIALSQGHKFGSNARIFPTLAFAEYLLMTGRYHEAQYQLEVLNTLVKDVYLGNFMQGRLTRILGWKALANRDYQEAETHFNHSIELNQQTSDDEQIAWSQAGLARAMIGQGKWDEAKQLLTEALWTSIEIKGFIPMIFTLPFSVLFMAQENLKLASKLYRIIRSSPFLTNAPYFDDVVYRHLPDEIRDGAIPDRGKIPASNEDLWNAASTVLSSWIQVWMGSDSSEIKRDNPSLPKN